jgi:hypothetical protein
MFTRLKNGFLGLAAAALVAVAALAPISAPPAHAASLTDYAEGELIKHIFRTGSFTKPTVLAVGLLTASCSDSAAGTEVTGGSYARVQVNPADANWAAITGNNGTTSNVSAITFPAPTANWGSVTHFAIYDATSSGNMLVCQALTTPKTINNGDAAPSFGAGALTFQIDN